MTLNVLEKTRNDFLIQYSLKNSQQFNQTTVTVIKIKVQCLAWSTYPLFILSQIQVLLALISAKVSPTKVQTLVQVVAGGQQVK